MEVDTHDSETESGMCSPVMFLDCSQEDNRTMQEGENVCEDYNMSSVETVEESTDVGHEPTDKEWRGVPLEELWQGCGPWGPAPAAPVIPSSYHTVLIKLPVKPGCIPDPYPTSPVDLWDQDHVRMPNSAESLYPVQEGDGERGLRVRWELIQESLLCSIMSSQQLETAILSYNSRYNERWDFCALHSFFCEVLEEEEADYFFTNVLPKLVELALQLPYLLTSPIPLLKAGHSRTVTISQLQIASLLANAFFCTFPRRNTTKRGSEYAAYPDINFNRLFQCGTAGNSSTIMEKFKCLLNYFRRVSISNPKGVLTFSRRYIPPGKLPAWAKSNKSLPKLHITSSGFIEDEGAGMLQVDFANKFVGGGVLGWGCVQEEIRFVICPELIVSRLFTECLDSTEALLIIGCERFSSYSGYGNSFQWTGDYEDVTPFDSNGRRHCSIIAVDALHFSYSGSQYSLQNIVRELNKAYVGFYESDQTRDAPLSAVATGNWGCGAFRGDAHLKALLQLMAAAEAGRALAYFTFGDKTLRDRIFNMHKFLVEKKVTVGALWEALCQYSKKFSCAVKGSEPSLYPFIYHTFEQPHNNAMSPEVQRPKPILLKKKKMQSKEKQESSGKNSDSTLAETDLMVEDLETLIEDADTEEEDKDQHSLEKSPVNVKQSVSCLDLIEKGFGESVERKTGSLPRTKLITWDTSELPSAIASTSQIKSQNNSKSNVQPSDSPSRDSVGSLPSIMPVKNEVGDTDSCCTVNISSPMDCSEEASNNIETSELVKNDIDVSKQSSSSHSKSSAPKRKISDYFSVANR